MGAGMRTSPLVVAAFGGAIAWIAYVGPARVVVGLVVVLACLAGLTLARHPRLRRRHDPPTSGAPTT